MKKIAVKLKAQTYPIVIGNGILEEAGKYITRENLGKDAFIITNKSIYGAYAAKLNKSLKESKISAKFKLIADTEKSKSLRIAYAVINDLARFDKKKQLFIIAFGGGVVGDLAGFIASIYKRGTPFIQIPTTLLAQVDSSIGGKTGVDLTFGKNLIGAFYQPRLVLSDTGLLATLPIRQVSSGLAEIIKYAVIQDPKLFAFLEKNHKLILKLDKTALEYIIARCAAIKAKIVGLDEKETKGIRTVLNFGHTIGHALEAASGYLRYTHGEAIALGMLVASEISQELGLTNRKSIARIEGLIKAFGLPLNISGTKLEDIIKIHYRDKKFMGKRNRFVLLEKIGKVKVREGIPLKIIEAALKRRITT